MNTLVQQLANLQVTLYHMASMYDIGNININGSTGGSDFTVGSDTITGGAGNDNIVGDNATWIGTSRYGVPNLTDGDDIVEQTVTFHRYLLDMSHAISDTEHAVGWANQQADRALRVNRLQGARLELNRNALWMHNDTIHGDDGNDVIAGDHSIVVMPIVTGVVAFKSFAKEQRLAIGRKDKASINRQIRIQSSRMLAELRVHVARDRRALLAVRPISTVAGRMSFDIHLGNDMIDAGLGDDTVAGDTLFVTQPAFNVSPESQPERGRLRGRLRRLMKRLRSVGVDYSSNVNYTGALRIPRRGQMEVVLSTDTILGGGGDDVLFGDNAEMSPYSFPKTEFVSGRYEVRSVRRPGRVYSNTSRGGNDTMDGGDGDDKIDGQYGFDVLTGGQGVDAIYGGPQRDTIVQDDADLIVRKGGRIPRNTLVDTSDTWLDHLNSVMADRSSEMDTNSILWIRIRLKR